MLAAQRYGLLFFALTQLFQVEDFKSSLNPAQKNGRYLVAAGR